MGSSASLDRSPRSNWVEKAGELPPYIREIARAVEKTGKPLSQAIPIAISRVKIWAAGGGNVSAKTRAKSVEALALWEGLKLKNKSRQTGELSAKGWESLQGVSDLVVLSVMEVRLVELCADAGYDVRMVSLSKILNAGF